jgi:multimeric flavodoxin WrbA
MAMPKGREGQATPELTRPRFNERLRQSFADPDYELSVEGRATRDRLQQVQERQRHPSAPSRMLLICGSPRNDGSCPGEVSKTFRLLGVAREVLLEAGVEVDVLDLSRITSECGRTMHPCHALGQIDDRMAEIHEHWTAAHGVMILTPVHWYQAPSVLKLMIDRLVCADGGNPDPTSTGGKNAERAKALELKGWGYPKHPAGRAYGLVVHGDVQGVLEVRRALSDWLDGMGLIDAGEQARLDRFIGYYEPYATSHDALDRDTAVQDEVRNVARALLHAVAEIRAGRLTAPDKLLGRARP